VFKIVEIKNEFNDAKENFKDDDYVILELWSGKYDHLRLTIIGKEGTPYAGGKFVFEIKMKEETSSSPYRIRFSKEDLNSDKTVGDFKRENRGLIPGIAAQLIFKGKVLPDQLKLKDLGFHPEKDVITIMVTQVGSPPLWNNGEQYCVTLIWHPNIDPTIPPGKQNFHLGGSWNPNVNLIRIIEGIKALIHMKSPIFDLNLPLNREAGEQYLNNRSRFERKARKWTYKYAEGTDNNVKTIRNLSYKISFNEFPQKLRDQYIPKELIEILIKTTLQPLVEDKLNALENNIHIREKAILDIKICDPACGTGDILLIALEYLARKLAELRTSSPNPLDIDILNARRDVLRHCIYGVDSNPYAVEMTKKALWRNTRINKGPRVILDSHIKCGNSLIGLGQKNNDVIIKPQNFEAISGNRGTGIESEDRKLQNLARELIRGEIQELDGPFTHIPITDFTRKTQVKREINCIDLANIWTSTFFWPLEGEHLGEIPRNLIINQLRIGIINSETENILEKISNIAEDYKFFHWYCEFPEVFNTNKGGFDCILTKPPWDVLEFKELEFFIGRDENILSAPNKSERRRLINALPNTNPQLFNQYQKNWKKIKKQVHFYENIRTLRLSSKVKINKYLLFTERCWQLINHNGYVGMINPTGIIYNYQSHDLIRALIRSNSIISVLDFENKHHLFDTHINFRFCLFSFSGRNLYNEFILISFFNSDPRELQANLLQWYENRNNLQQWIMNLPDDYNIIPLSRQDLELVNPNTLTIPQFKNIRDFRITKHIYNQTDILIRRDETNNIVLNPWNVSIRRGRIELHRHRPQLLNRIQLEELGANPANLDFEGGIWTEQNENIYVPIYTGRRIWQWDFQYNLHENAERIYWINITDLEHFQENNINGLNLVYREIIGLHNKRTFISTLIPFNTIERSLYRFDFETPNFIHICCLLANLNSIIFDFCVRQKIFGMNLNSYTMKQLPVFPPERYNENLRNLIIPRVLELIYTSHELEPFAAAIGFDGEPFEFALEARAFLMAELDAIFAKLYNITRDDLENILDTFDVLMNDEMREFGEYRTRRLILEAFDGLNIINQND